MDWKQEQEMFDMIWKNRDDCVYLLEGRVCFISLCVQ